jgi:hypothetical protein
MMGRRRLQLETSRESGCTDPWMEGDCGGCPDATAFISSSSIGGLALSNHVSISRVARFFFRICQNIPPAIQATTTNAPTIPPAIAPVFGPEGD